jgi:hypothetical protein
MLGKMKAKGGPLPPPQPLKGMQVSSGANVGRGLPFMTKSIYLKQGWGRHINSKNTSSKGNRDFEQGAKRS